MIELNLLSGRININSNELKVYITFTMLELNPLTTYLTISTLLSVNDIEFVYRGVNFTRLHVR